MVSFKFSLLTCNASSTENTIPLVYIKGIDTSGGQCTWCGRYGHNKSYCPLLK
ncbi:hypothetical protein BDF21DRAFT_491009 [Thamnidium elegans]|nr:hypothetical protein BDF21DRAFT_491009 [Thamnidium elegans]